MEKHTSYPADALKENLRKINASVGSLLRWIELAEEKEMIKNQTVINQVKVCILDIKDAVSQF